MMDIYQLRKRVAKYGFFVFLFLSSGAMAGPATDELSRCLVKETTKEDQIKLIRWVFGAMSFHPEVKSLSNVSQKQSEILSKDAAELMMDLLAARCKTQTKGAVTNDGPLAIKAAFQVLGTTAMQGLMTNPEVLGYMSQLESNVDAQKLQEVFTEQPAK